MNEILLIYFIHSVSTFRWFLNRILYNPYLYLEIWICWYFNCQQILEYWYTFIHLWSGHGTGLNSCIKCWTGRAITCLFCQSRDPQSNHSAMYWLTRNGQSRFCQPLRSSVSKLKMIVYNCMKCIFNNKFCITSYL